MFGDADPEQCEFPPAEGANGLRWLVCVRYGMDAIIPAAGHDSRLGELMAARPKGLVDVAGRPLPAHGFETAIEAGAEELVVVVGYEAAQIVDRFDDTFEGIPITYVHQRERLGLRHAMLQAEPHVDGPFLFVNGDNVLTGSVAPAVAATTGVIETGEQGHVTGLIEKPAEPLSTLVTIGCYVLPEGVFHACALLRLSAEGEHQLSEAVGLLVRAGYEVVTVRVGERVNVNTSEDIERASELVREESRTNSNWL
jgi:glucose-1-phosphate thymidylyltransferase